MILVLGSNGQVGFELKQLLPDSIFLLRAECDLGNEACLRELFQKYKFSTLINAAAYTQVDEAEDFKDLAFQINAEAPSFLAKLCKEHSVKFVHFSTDYVFDGNSETPYLENDPICPINYYGLTKAEGEKKILIANSDALIIRTSWVYSVHGKNFVKTMLALGNSKSELRVVSDQFGSPTWAHELAKMALMAKDKGLTGIYHYSQEGKCSWADFAMEIKRLTSFKATIIPISTAEYPTKAKRPKYSLLSKNKIKQDLKLDIPNWKDSLARMIQDLKD